MAAIRPDPLHIRTSSPPSDKFLKWQDVYLRVGEIYKLIFIVENRFADYTLNSNQWAARSIAAIYLQANLP